MLEHDIFSDLLLEEEAILPDEINPVVLSGLASWVQPSRKTDKAVQGSVMSVNRSTTILYIFVPYNTENAVCTYWP
ncbi:hypothetical protein M0802_008407 [Mischocyttarus mexicanus]|nr:hypothetical protein M0802_008407 [Mischocyttarus mexicanus]